MLSFVFFLLAVATAAAGFFLLPAGIHGAPLQRPFLADVSFPVQESLHCVPGLPGEERREYVTRAGCTGSLRGLTSRAQTALRFNFVADVNNMGRG